LETIHTDKLPNSETLKPESSGKPVSVQERVMVGRLLQNTVQKLSQEGLEAVNVHRAMQSIKGAFPNEFAQLQVQHRQAQIDNPLPDSNNLKPLSQQTKNSWFDGQVVAASVIKSNNDGSATVVIDKQTVDLKLPANSPLKLEVGQRLALTVEKGPNRPLSFALSHSPEQSAKLLSLVESSSHQQRTLSPMLATLDAIVQRVSQLSSETGQVSNNKVYPEGFVKAVRELAGQISSGQQLANPEGLKQAVSQSGLFLENNLKISQTDSIDLNHLNNILKAASTKTSNTPLSQSLQQLQTSAQQLAPRINNQVNISPEISQTLQKAFVEQQQQITLSLKSDANLISKPELMTVLQSLTQLASRSENTIVHTINSAIVEQKPLPQIKEAAVSPNSESLKQLQQAIKQLVLDTSNNTFSREQIAQLNSQSSNLSELSNTLKSLATNLQGANQTLFIQSKPLVQTVSQAVIELAGDQLSKSQFKILKQNPQSLSALSQSLKTSAQVLEFLPNKESRAQVDKLIQSLNSILNTEKSSDKSISGSIEKVTAQFTRAIQASSSFSQATLAFPKMELSNVLKSLSDEIQYLPQSKQNQTRAVVKAISLVVIEYAGKNINKAQLNNLQQNPLSPTKMATSLSSAAQVIQSVPINPALQQKVLQTINRTVSEKIVSNQQLATQIKKIVSESLDKAQQKPTTINISKAELANTIKTLASTLQNSTPNQLNTIKPIVQNLTQAVISYAGNNITSSQISQLQQAPQSLSAAISTMKTAADIIQSSPLTENRAVVEKLLSSIQQSASQVGNNNRVILNQIDKVLAQLKQPIPENQNKTNSAPPSINSAESKLSAAQLLAISKANLTQTQSIPNPSDSTSKPIVNQNVKQNIPNQPAPSNTSNSLSAEQIAALKMLREALSQSGQQNNSALTQALSKTVIENADKLLSAQQSERLVQNANNPKELSLALKAIEEKVAKMAKLTSEQQKQIVDKVSQALLNNADKANLNKELSGLKTANISQADLSLALKNIAQTLDKNTLESNPQIKRLMENISQTISEISKNNFSPKLLQNLLQQPPKSADIMSALRTLQSLIKSTGNPTNSFPAHLVQSISQTIATSAERILQPSVLTQLQKQPNNLTELQTKFELLQNILTKTGDNKLFQADQDRVIQFGHDKMLQSVAKNLVQNSSNPIPFQQLNQLAKQPTAISPLLSVLQSLNQAGGDKNNNNFFVNQMLQNISNHISQAANQGSQLNQFNQIAQTPSQKIPELLKQLSNLSQTVENNRPTSSNNYPKQFVKTVNQFIQQISQQFQTNNQALTSNNELSFLRSQVNNFSQQIQKISQAISQSLNSNPTQTQISQQVMQDFRVNIQRLLNVMQQIPGSANPTTTASPQLSPAASLGQAFSTQQTTLSLTPETLTESGKEMPLANKSKHAQVVQAQQNPAFQLANLATFQQAFIEQLEGALARIMATQGGNREQADNNLNMALEIPFRFQEKSQVLQLKMRSTDKEFDDTGGKIWTANLAFELQSMGPIRIYITLDGKDVSMQFWTEKAESQVIFQENFTLLTERLAIAGYRVSQLGSYLGVPDEARQEIKQNKQGVVDEHV